MEQIKQKILVRATQQGAQVTALRERVLDIILKQHSGVIKAYTVLAQMQQATDAVVAPPTAYRALDFWAEQGVLHKVAAVNGYVLCSHARHVCDSRCHDSRDNNAFNHSAFILVCSECGAVDEQTLSREWAALCAGVAANGFHLTDEYVVLTGICSLCRQ